MNLFRKNLRKKVGWYKNEIYEFIIDFKKMDIIFQSVFEVIKHCVTDTGDRILDLILITLLISVLTVNMYVF